MAAAIKKFFEKRKLDVKFKVAGEGRRLNSSASPPARQEATVVPVMRTAEAAEQQRAAAQAALARINQQQKGSASGSSKALSSTSLKSQVRQEMEAKKKEAEKATALAARYASPREVELDAAPMVGHVLFRCPLVGEDVVLPKEQMAAHIEGFLLSQLAEEPAMAAALMIHTLNQNADAVKQCIETIGKYLENIAANPTDEKYRRIRASNKVLAERVLALQGAEEFLQAAGFAWKTICGADGSSEEFVVFGTEGEPVDVERVSELREILTNAEPIRPELDHDVRVYYCSPNASKMAVPDEFFRISADEIRREQQTRAEAVEQFGMLRTKQMRERDRIRELRRYRYCLVRVRLPDGVLLQGTFHASDKLSTLRSFVHDCLVMDWIPFFLSNSTGQRLNEDNATLAELDLAPASLLSLTFDPEMMNEMAANFDGNLGSGPFLKPELMSAICSL